MVTETELDLRSQLERIEKESATSPDVAEALDAAAQKILNSGILELAPTKGDRAPDFTLPNAAGIPYRLSDGVARGPVVVTFYRGSW